MKTNRSPLTLFAMLAVFLVVFATLPSLRASKAVSRPQDPSLNQSDVKPKAKKSANPSKQPSLVTAPVNDNCANAINITPANCPFTNTQDTTAATDEAGEPQSTCTLQANSVWYTFTNNTTGTAIVTVSTCTSAPVDTAVMVWQAPGAPCDFNTFVAVACNDDACGDGLQSQLGFTAPPGGVFKIQVGGFDGETGIIKTDVTCTVLNCPPLVINGTLGTGDPAFTGTQVSGNQNARLNRNGIGSTCAAPKSCLVFGPGTFPFDSYVIPNQSGQSACVAINLTVANQASCNLQSNAYIGTFDPNNICTGYLGDPGLSSGSPPTPTNFSVIVPAGQSLIVEVHSVNTGTGTGCPYTLTLLGDLCQQFDYCVQDDVKKSFIQISSTTGAYKYQDCSKGITVEGTGVTSTDFCKINLFDSGPNPKRPDRSISVLVNPCTKAGSASLRLPGSMTTLTLNDANITNNTCSCPH